jgi:hypothetical protein
MKHHHHNAEIVSEKRKRGRPKRFDLDVMRVNRALYPEIKTGRGLQNKLYLGHAMQVLGRGERKAYRWLLWHCQEGAEPFRSTLLCELGRFNDDRSLRKAARWLCEFKPTAAAGVRILRQWRLGRSAPASAEKLLRRLSATIDDWLLSRPDDADSLVPRALRQLLADFAGD